jgi:nicotinamidase-related amidase
METTLFSKYLRRIIMEKAHLLLIDPQNDFMDVPFAGGINPALAVPGANADMDRVAAFVKRLGNKLYDIHVTLDSHHVADVAHPSIWRNATGDYPGPFTSVSAADIAGDVWYPRDARLKKQMVDYAKALEANGRYPLIIWPEHCLIGTPGHNVQASVMTELNNWARKGMQLVDFVTKGSNWTTEHYSAVKAEVPDPSDPSTTLNQGLINVLREADVIYIAGEALSHCVANTVRDIADNFGDENISKLVLLTDCTSSVISPFVDFPKIASDFVNEMKARGMKTALSTEIYA